MTDDQTPADIETGADNGLDHDAEQSALEAGEALVALQAEVAELRDRLLRTAAEAENTRRRTEREANDARAYAIQKFARDLLGVADNLSRAMQHAPHDSVDGGVKNFVLGIEMTEKELQQAFERNGLKRVDPPRGAKFDPHLHQAMMEQDGEDVEAGGVIQVLQAGYELYGRIVRPALVVVAAKGGAKAAHGGYAQPDGAEAGGSVDTTA